MKNKKGLLLASEMVKIIIAVIAVAFLVYFLSMLYFSKVAEEKGRQATEILLGSGAGSVKSQLSLVTETASKNVSLKNPIGWYLFSFTGNEDKPNSCTNLNCLCICENVMDVFNRQIKYCDKTGACLVIKNLDPKTNLKDTDFEIEKQPVRQLLIRMEGGVIKLSKK
jgi:hypothetical protein